MKVPFTCLTAHYQRNKSELDNAVRAVMESGWYVGGPHVQAFESEFARFSQAQHAVGVANGTDAITLALLASGIKSGDEVIVPALSAYPTTVGIVQAGAVPIFVDVRREDGLLDMTTIEAALTPATRAVVPVHLFGNVCDMPALVTLAAKHRLIIVEDCAQAHGASMGGQAVGTFGTAAAWSFYPTKNLGAMGDAGAVTTADATLAARLKRLRNYGQSNRYEHVERGINSRLDALQAAILSVGLHTLSAENEVRRQIASAYDVAFVNLQHVQRLLPPKGAQPSRHIYPLRLVTPAQREAFQAHLAALGIETLIHYPIAMPEQKASEAHGRSHPFPAARALCQSLVSLPIYADLTEAQVRHVIDAVGTFAAQKGLS